MTGRTEKRYACALCDAPQRVACRDWCPNHPDKVAALEAEVERMVADGAARGHPPRHRLDLLLFARERLKNAPKAKP